MAAIAALAVLAAKVGVEEACKGGERAVVRHRPLCPLVTRPRTAVSLPFRCLAGGGEAIGEGCDSGAGGAGDAGGEVWSTEGGSSKGEGARFFGRG
jgi:hypothetical protein